DRREERGAARAAATGTGGAGRRRGTSADERGTVPGRQRAGGGRGRAAQGAEGATDGGEDRPAGRRRRRQPAKRLQGRVGDAGAPATDVDPGRQPGAATQRSRVA